MGGEPLVLIIFTIRQKFIGTEKQGTTDKIRFF